MPELIRHLTNDDPAFKSVRNNAIWAVGEISMRWKKERMECYVEPIIRSLVPLIYPQFQSVELQENAVNTIGRLGIHNSEITALFLPQFCRAWLYRAGGMRENEEKDSAFQGFCKTVCLHPHALNEVVSFSKKEYNALDIDAISRLGDTHVTCCDQTVAKSLIFAQVPI